MLNGLRIGFKLKQDSPKFGYGWVYGFTFHFSQFSLSIHFYHFVTFHFSLFHFTRDSPKQIKLGSDVMIKDYKSDLTTGPLF